MDISQCDLYLDWLEGGEYWQYWTSTQVVGGELVQHWEGESLLQLMIFITLSAVEAVYNITYLD